MKNSKENQKLKQLKKEIIKGKRKSFYNPYKY